MFVSKLKELDTVKFTGLMTELDCIGISFFRTPACGAVRYIKLRSNLVTCLCNSYLKETEGG